MAHEHENEWQSYVGVKYTLLATTDFVNWVTLVDKRPGDGTMQSHVDITNEPRRTYKLLQDFTGMEPKYLRAITSWDGSGVTLEWNAIGASPNPNAGYHLIRNGGTPGILIQPITVTTYRDTSVSSGQHYTYTLPVYGG